MPNYPLARTTIITNISFRHDSFLIWDWYVSIYKFSFYVYSADPFDWETNHYSQVDVKELWEPGTQKAMV